ncbi:MAG TPA: NUDIX hydrolase N-terminal domain-containing protein [Gaiellaceae bacterium]|nr:NUDIX hydrolase N-terminal domain-containing protein [Gaiellaceae bacterium]
MGERLRWARRLQAIAQSGLTYTENPYDRARFEAVREVAAEIAASASGEEQLELLARFADEAGYATPKVDVRGVVLEQGRVLLVREVGETRWALPGGWADVGDTPSRAVEKEVREEAGVEARAVRVLAVYDRDFRGRPQWPAHVYKLYVLCERVAGEPAGDGLETEEAAFFPLDDLPQLSAKTPAEHLRGALAVAAEPAGGAAID